MDSSSSRVEPPARTDHSSWWCEAIAAEFQFSPEVLQSMRAESVEGLMRLARGGIECAGVLYGLRTADSVRVLAAQPLACEHRFGPSFLLSDKDEPALQEMLDGAKQPEQLRGLEPLGWYVSHCRRGPALADSDVRISNQYFHKPGGLTIVVLPEKSGQALARVFVRDRSGALDPQACARELILPSAIAMLQANVLQAHAAASPPPATPPPVEEPQPRPSVKALVIPPAVPPSVPAISPSYHPWSPSAGNSGRELAEGREVALNRLQNYLQQQEKHRRVSSWNLIATLGLLMVCVGAAGGYFWLHLQSRKHDAAAVILRVSEAGPQLRIEWDPTSDAVETATSGELEIRESDGSPVYAKVDHQALLAGSAVYNHRSEKVEIRLHLSYPNARQAESVVYFISPTASAAAKPVADPMPGKKPDDARRDTTAEVNSPRPVVATRTFEPPKIARQEPVQVTLNSTPLPTGDALSPKPALPVLPFPTPSAAPPPPPAPATVAAKPAEPARPRFGRLIWTGELDRNALLTLSSSGASLGWANGKLPGFPITISLHPADLVAGGIQVFTRDQKLVSRAEPPSAENGWNTIVYKYDPKTAPDVHVIQPPSAANSWNQLVVQNGKKPISVIVIDWQRAADSH